MKNKNMVFGLMVALMLMLSAISVFMQDAAALTLSTEPNIRATLLSQEPDPVQPGRYVEVRFQIENLGAYKAENMVFELVPEYPFSLDSTDTVKRTFGSFYGRAVGDEAAVLYYKLRVDSNAVEGTNTLKLKYSIDNGDSWAYFNDFDIRVQSLDSQVGILSVTTEPPRLVPGQESKLSIKISNMGESFVHDVAVKLDLSSTTLPFAPINSATEQKLKTIAAGKIGQVDFNIVPLGSAESDIYKVPILVTYYDSAGTSHSKSDYISLIVGTAPDILVMIDSQDVYSSGASGTVSVKFVNKGVTGVKFLTVTLLPSDKFDMLSSSDVYLGKLDSDDYESADFKLYLKSTTDKTLSMPIKLVYTDANNQEYTQDVNLPLRLYSGSELKKFGIVKGGSSGLWLILIVLAVAGYFIYRRVKKQKAKK